ncbi:MAG: long-chain fatty acid--CoA ligase [Bacteroidia bacterium]|nr:MAG: long-chain fatty acid--CoA ligase [Bacteroidia bacterium]
MMKSLINFFEENVDKYSSNPYMWEKRDGSFKSTSYAEMRELVYQFAAGMMTIGVKKGDRLALLAEGRTWWVVAEMGMFYLGAMDVPLSIQLNEPADLTFRLKHSGAKMIVVSSSQLKKIESIKSELPDLEKIILMDPKEKYGKDEVYMGDLMEDGKKLLEKDFDAFKKVYESVSPDDIANICYTSGTTADPKGIMLSQRNYTANTEQALTVMSIPQDYIMFLFLPWDHSFAHTAGLFTIMATGASLASLEMGKTGFETRKNISKNIQEIKPNLMFSVPTITKNFRNNIESGVRAKGNFTWKLFKAGMKIAYNYNGIGWDRGKGMKIFLKPLYLLFDVVVFSKVRKAMGGNMDFFIGGGALLDIELQRFFYAIGIPMYQGYGLTEASPMISINSPERHKMGASGNIPENLEVKICNEEGIEVPLGEKGEIVIRGENVMKGYWKNEEATADTIRNEWLYTGDMGYLDADGFLYVLGRYKSLLIADDGEKYSPEGIEEAFTDQSEYVEQCLLHNNQNPYTVALVHPNAEALKRFLKSKGFAPDSKEGIEACLSLLDNEIREYRSQGKYGDMFPQRWIPANLGILSEGFTVENKLMNPTMKVVRPKVEEHYQELFTFLYTPQSKNVINEKNVEALKILLNE